MAEVVLLTHMDIIYADLDMDKVYMSKREFDVCGHYARPDVLKLQVNEK